MFEISKLKELKLSELQEIAEKLNISKYKTLKKLDLYIKSLIIRPQILRMKKKIHLKINLKIKRF